MTQVMHKKDVHDIVVQLTREDCEEVLEDHGFEVYAWESLDVLKRAIEVNLFDGTIQPQSPLLVIDTRVATYGDHY